MLATIEFELTYLGIQLLEAVKYFLDFYTKDFPHFDTIPIYLWVGSPPFQMHKVVPDHKSQGRSTKDLKADSLKGSNPIILLVYNFEKKIRIIADLKV